MTEPSPQPSRWLQGAVALFLSAQLALLWLQGLQLNRQHHDLAGLREDLQALAESLDNQAGGPHEEGESYAPAHRRAARRQRWVRVNLQEEEKDPAVKELQASKASAEKAVKDARKVQSQLSIAENARKAEEKAKIKEEVSHWEKWALLAAGVVLGAILLRGWLKARED